ncbi:PAS domain S-box protein [uncultured Methanobacterium sp.]|uniref:PAS domain S-box protein n=1 Tax=uncultured Methanobacterium sp. TaxID=176306 RepID=UPI002AA7E50E|nr:PAS domain S-box protein [uncultured Methanobacterium sp.]
MSGTNIILAMDNDTEALKINQILSSGNCRPLTLFNWKNPQWEISNSEKNGQQVSSGNSTSNMVDTTSLDLDSVDLIIMDEELQENIELKTFLEGSNNINSTYNIPRILITSNSDCKDPERIDLKEKQICLSRPYNPRELLLTVESAFYKKNMELTLKEREDQYRILIENADDPIAMINYQGEFLLVNKSAAIFFSCEEEKFLGKTMWEIFPQEQADSQMKSIRTVIETGTGRIIESKTVIKGKEYYFSTNIQPIPVKNGGIGAVQLIARDITPMKKVQHALEKSEEKFREVFNNANDGISLHHIDNGLPGNFCEVNDVVCQRLGYTKEELLLMGPQDIINKETKEKMPEVMKKLSLNKSATFEAVQFTKEGKLITTEISNHLFDLQGKEMIMSITRDISERKKSENQLLRILAGIEGTGDAIGIAMSDGSHFYQNKSFNKLFGYKVEELNIPMGPVKLFKDKELGRYIFQTIMNGNSWDGELEMTDKSERIFPVHIQANAIKNKNDSVIGLIYVLDDITERKRVEYALKTSEEKFRNLAQTAVDAIIIIDCEEKIVFSNSSLERIFDYREEEILGEYLETLIPQRHMEDFQVKLDFFHQHDRELGNVFESFGLRKDGSEFPLEMSLNTWKTEGDVYTTLIIRDITQRKLNEFKFKMREDIFQLMAHNIEEVFWIIDPLTGQILYMNPAYKKIWGQNIETLYQNPRSWIESMHPEDKEEFISYIFGKNGRTIKHRENIECRVIRPDGEVRWIKVRAFPVINQNKEIYRRIGIATDISKVRNMGNNIGKQ